MNMKWVQEGDIKKWAEGRQKDCQQKLPELLRRLLLANPPDAIQECYFPSGDSTSNPGWDGHLTTSIQQPFFPSGVSRWEIGADKSASKKAETEYNKRTKDPIDVDPKNTSFIFVTPRSWPGHATWQKTKKKEKKWKDVRVFNLDHLVSWLDYTPAVALWLAREIGNVISGDLQDLEGFWNEWSVGTSPSMTPELVIAGREKDVEQIQQWVIGNPEILEVEGDHPDEAFSFLYASIVRLPENERFRALARCIKADSVSEVRAMTQAYEGRSLIFAIPGKCNEIAAYAKSRGHHVFIAMDNSSIGIKATLRLSRPQIEILEKLLQGSGLTEVESQRIAKDSGRSIPVLRRHLSQSHAISAPKWTQPDTARFLTPALLAGSWDESKEGDKLILEALSGLKYADLIAGLIPLLKVEDAPILKIGSVWAMKSSLDAWFLLAKYLTNDSLKLFSDTVQGLFIKKDDYKPLSPTDEDLALRLDDSGSYSQWIRNGLSHTLILISIYGNRATGTVSTSSLTYSVVREIFGSAKTLEAWASLKDVTPALAEADPDTFMTALEECLVKNPNSIQQLMQDNNKRLFGECYHAGLLWALESIAWSSEYFSRAVMLLAKLAHLDSGGRWANRAINSLNDIFLPGFPQTYASAEERLAVLDALISQYPKMVWEFSQNYYKGGHFSESYRFRWRDAGGNRRGLQQEDAENALKYSNGLIARHANLSVSKDNIISTLEEFVSLPTNLQEGVLNALKNSIRPAEFSKGERTELLDRLRETINWISTYGDQETRIHENALRDVLEIFTPEDVIERLGWILVTPWPRFPQKEPEEYAEKESFVKKAQQQAARELLDQARINEILDFASTAQYPGVLGNALGIVASDEEDPSILDEMIKRNSHPLLIKGYSQGRVEVKDENWIDKQIARMREKGNYSSEVCALLCFGMPENARTWLSVAKRGKEVEMAYWKQASGYSTTDRNADAPMAVQKLLDARRAEVALQIAGDSRLSIPTTLLVRILEDVLLVDDDKHRVNEDYYIAHILERLYERNELTLEELVRLEFPFASIFDDIKRHTSKTLATHRLLQQDPEFFAQLVSLIYKRDDGKSDQVSKSETLESRKQKSNAAYGILESWRSLPGLVDTGIIDEEKLEHWIEAARKYCIENNRITGCDLQIAFILARSPTDEDGYWPHIAIRNIIERLNSGLIDRHIEIGIYNSRGVTTRSPNEGGRQERELVEKYKQTANALKSKWPRSAAILRSIAKSYEQDAIRHDVDANLRELR